MLPKDIMEKVSAGLKMLSEPSSKTLLNVHILFACIAPFLAIKSVPHHYMT